MAGNIGVKMNEWNSVVNGAKSSVNALSTSTKGQINKTTSKRFKKLPELEKMLTEVTKSYKEVASVDLDKMMKVAQNMTEHDLKMAQEFKKNIQVRFK